MYPGITHYRENYILPTALQNGRIHLGMGCYIHTNNARKDIRTLNNATAQFFSILTLLVLNKVHQLIDQHKLQDSIKCVSTIYDAIYYEVDKDPVIIKQLNDWLIPLMTQPFIENQVVPNDAESEIGYNWVDTVTIPHNATIQQIEKALHTLDKEA